MQEMQMKERYTSYVWLVVGSALLVFLGWRWNVPVAAWLAPVFLMRFFRTQTRWPATLVAIPLMAAGLFVNITGSWDFGLPAEIGISLLRAAPFLVPLYLERFLARRLKPTLGTLVYPAAYVALDYLMAFSPLGTVFSASATQFAAGPFIQLASLAGVWGIDFVMAWLAPVANLVWERSLSLKAAGRPAALFGVCLGVILLLGGLRLSFEPASDTVRVAGVTVAQPRDYWGEIIDRSTPADQAHAFAGEMASLNDALFAQSARAAQAGARIVFWAEAEGVVFPEEEAAFVARGRAFAAEHEVYFAPAFIILRYGQATADNKVLMITPAGDVAYSYTKTKSWYPTDSDGILHFVDTPYGRLSSAICFDMDFPAFIHQAAKENVDIMLVPAFDWEPIKPYHTQVGLFRAVENGFSMVRQVNQGTSMAVDYQGRLLAYQDYFTTADPLMAVDVPTQGARTLYGALGDWFAYLSIAGVLALIVAGVRRRPKVAV